MSYRTEALDTEKMPSGIPYIISNEAAERFSFYGMKAILAIFIVQYLHLMGNQVTDSFSETEASNIVYTFNIAVYLTPVLGAILSDFLWGKYKTIMYLSVVYCIGHGILALMGLAGSSIVWLTMGLSLIALGAGGIKPCVSAHVGDQFGRKNKALLVTVFNWFYFAINLGAAVGSLWIPQLLQDYGPHVAFGVPGLLMTLATFVFWWGRKQFVHIPPSGRAFLNDVFSKRGAQILAKIIFIFILIIPFWSLFDQTATTWVFQSQDMNREIFGYTLAPSQIQATNPFLILVLIPLFTYVIYPMAGKFVKVTALRKMSVGLFLAAIAFAISAWIQGQIESGQTPHISWQLLAYVILTSSEIMVSIVCLEFAYTQAPKTMKSAIMSIFLLTVAGGNLLNIIINKALYAPSPHSHEIALYKEKQKQSPEDRYIQITDDSNKVIVTVNFHPNGTVKDRIVPTRVELDKAAVEIQEWANRNHKLPLTEQGQSIIQGFTDQWNNQLSYRLIKGSEARIRSNGTDQENKTRSDSILTLNYTTPEQREIEKNKDPKVGKTWLEKRKEKLNSEDKKDDYVNPSQRENFEIDYRVGGIAKVEGASHFWMFTGIMFLTSIIFIPVARLYSKSKSHNDKSPKEIEPKPDQPA